VQEAGSEWGMGWLTWWGVAFSLVIIVTLALRGTRLVHEPSCLGSIFV
jgi:hypothetical protein